MDAIDISEVARRTGLTSRALRFYEARGLVRPLRTDAGRRWFGPGEMARLNAVIALKRAGFPLSAIAKMLEGKSVDLARLVEAQLAETEARAAEITAARALLLNVQSRIDRGEPIDVATLCSLIRQGNMTMETENWQRITDRYITPEEKPEWSAQMANVPADFDQADYSRKWADLGGRIENALPLDPASDRAQAFLDEWKALLKPFTDVATPAMMAGANRLYDNMGEWQHEQKPPFSMQVWAFIKAAGAARAAA
ncbi:MAG: MerR family transcriptional regulator [Proteobacteria bacterium]|nr:MerR family transcriptional regulator [Pseudomonadota bacterium]